MITLINKAGFLNRHISGLPKDRCKINIHQEEGNKLLLCEWFPFNSFEYSTQNMPAEGYLGTATVIEKEWRGISFHAWKQNNSEFIYYTLI